MSEIQVYIDGEFYPESEARISVFDHGLLYGDGVFEGIRAYGGQVFLCREHIDRLYDSARFLSMEIPMDKKGMREMLYACLEKNGLEDAYFRLLVTRGVGDLGLSPRKCTGKGGVICICAGISLYPESMYRDGMRVVTAATQRTHPESVNPRVKSLNYLSSIMAKLEALNAGCEEAVMLNHRGEVAECTADNLFIVKHGVLKTPPLSACILGGCTRGCVLELARGAGMEAREETLSRFDLYTADEFFLTGSGAELIPVVEYDGRRIGDGVPGKATHDLLSRFRRYIKEYRDTGL